MITLTVRQIVELAGFAGLTLNSSFMPDPDCFDSEITIAENTDGKVTTDEGSSVPCRHYAYMTDYPEEGCHPLDDGAPT